MPQCRGTKRGGSQCTVTVDARQAYCWWHDPDNAARRRKAASKGGKGKPSREIRDLKKQLEDLAADVLAGRVERGDAVAVNQILNTRLRALEVERKIKETDELEARLRALEEAREDGRGGRSWQV